MPDLVTVAGLTKSFRGRGRDGRRTTVFAANDVSFTVARGETLGLVGESGSGKSTTGLLTLRLIEPQAGSIMFDGADVRAMSSKELRAWRRRAQMVFQDPFGSFDPRMTIERSLLEPLRIHDIGDAQARHNRIVELLDTIGLDERVLGRLPHAFSGGQLQRLAVARAIISEPDLVVCDEPVAALDMSIQAQVLNLLRDLQRSAGFSMIFISHDLSLVRVVAHRTAVLYQGRIVEMGPTKNLYDAPRHPYTQALLSSVPVPDPQIQRHRRRVELPLVAPRYDGCAFEPRCSHAMDVCRTVRPTLDDNDGVSVACHLYDGAGGPAQHGKQQGVPE